MQVPAQFKVRIGGNVYQDTPDLIVCDDQPILSVARDDDSGELHVDLVVFDDKGRQKAVVSNTEIRKGRSSEFKVENTESCYVVRHRPTGREVCKLRRCASTRRMDIDAYVATHTPDGALIHANPKQTNIKIRSTGSTVRGAKCALRTG